MSLALTGILFFCGFLQGAAGFGFGIFAVTFMVWLGLSLADAVIITALVSIPQLLVSVTSLRDHIRWRPVLYASALRLLCLPLGMWVLVKVNRLDADVIKLFLGTMLLAILALQLFVKSKPKADLSPAWAVAAFSLSGFLQGMVVMGGPPAVLWVMAQSWTNKETRAFLLSLFLFGHPVHLVLLYSAYRAEVWQPAQQGLAYIPVAMLAAWLGVRAGNLLPKVRLRQAAYGLLFVVALSSVFSQMLP